MSDTFFRELSASNGELEKAPESLGSRLKRMGVRMNCCHAQTKFESYETADK